MSGAFLSQLIGPSVDPSTMGNPLAVLGLQVGIVTDNADPEQRYRVKLEIPGLIDDGAETDWAMPLGTLGGGSPQRGGFVVPVIGSKVAVLFQNGDHENPYYLCLGWYDNPDTGGLETPQPAKDAGADAHRIAALQLGRFVFAVDERDDKLTFSAGAQDEAGAGIALTLDFKAKALLLQATTAILLRTHGQIDLEGTVITIASRLVTAGTARPI